MGKIHEALGVSEEEFVEQRGIFSRLVSPRSKNSGGMI